VSVGRRMLIDCAGEIKTALNAGDLAGLCDHIHLAYKHRRSQEFVFGHS